MHLTQTERPTEAIMRIGRRLYPHFSLDDEKRRHMYKSVYYALTGDMHYYVEDIDPNKGVLISGSYGVGKSDLFRVLQRLFVNTPVHFAALWVRYAREMLRENNRGANILLKEYGYDLKKDLYIDDLGMLVADFKSYLNTVNILQDLLYDRSELYVKEGFKTHMTSNLILENNKNPADIKTLKSYYGDAVHDRFFSTVNILGWKGESLRGREEWA